VGRKSVALARTTPPESEAARSTIAVQPPG
jgi:hypothetical protein